MTIQREEVLVDSVERLATMSAEQVDELPYGFLILDGDGKILLYNRYESQMSRLPPDRVLGRSWFHEVAPCTRVEAFFGRFRRMIDDPSVVVDRFSFRFHFLHGAQDVTVQLSRAPGDDARVFMTVVRRNVEGLTADGPEEMTLDQDRGALVGAMGVGFPVPASAMARLLDRVGERDARELGEGVGRSLAASAERQAQRAAEVALGEAPLLLRSGVLDGVISRAGFGRIALDFSALDRSGAIGVVVRPPSPAVSAGLAAFYEGLLATALGATLQKPLLARSLDGADRHRLPWLFAVVPEELASLLGAAGSEPAAVTSRRLGIFVGDEMANDEE